jgi:hypothetical protein
MKKLIVCFVPCLSLTFMAQAQSNVFDWTFSVAGNPASPNAATTINPSGGTANASFIGNNNTYIFGNAPGGFAGTPTGLWDVQNGQVQLAINRTSVNPVDLTLVVTEFSDRSIYPGTMSFSFPGAQFVSETVVVPQTGIMTGAWYAETFSWSQFNLGLNPITLDISPSPANGGLLLDEVQFTINGPLVAVPEPGYGALTAAGLLAFGIRSWLRRKA